MGLIYRVPHELYAGIGKHIKKSANCHEWVGRLDRFDHPCFRFSHGGKTLYITPRFAVYELCTRTSLELGTTVTPYVCKNTMCCNYEHMTVVPCKISKNRVFSSITGLSVGSLVPEPIRAAPRSLVDMLHVGVPIGEIMASLNVTRAHVVRMAQALRIDWVAE